MNRFALIACVFWATPALAGTLPVSGTGTVKVEPDEVLIRAVLVSEAKTANAALTAGKQDMKSLLGILGKRGIDPTQDVRAVNLRVVPEYTTYEYEWVDSVETRTLLTGFQVRQSFELCLHDPRQADAVLDLLTRRGVKEVGRAEYRAKNQAALEQQALELAVKDAQHKAKLLADAAGMQLVKIASMRETGIERKAGKARAEAGHTAPTSAKGTFAIQARVEITYEVAESAANTAVGFQSTR